MTKAEQTTLEKIRDILTTQAIGIGELAVGLKDVSTLVKGNGKESYETRITRLETTVSVSNWFIGKMVAIAAIIGGLMPIILKLLGLTT